MRYLKDLRGNFTKKTALLRLDFNTDGDWRIKAAIPTIKFLLKRFKTIIIISHKGRPELFDHQFSLTNESKILEKLLHKKISFIDNFNFEKIRKNVHVAKPKSIFLLENLRFLKGESENDLMLAKKLASLGDIYVNDAFAVSHRANASIAGIAKFIKSFAGLEFESEIRNLSQIMKRPKKPLIVILGGLKIKDKLSVYDNLKSKASVFLIGGALDSNLLKIKLPKLLMPIDFLKENGAICDIGPKTIELFKNEIKKARTVIWNGPVGDIRKKQYESATREIAKSIAANKKAFKVIGGGETVMFVKKMKLDKKISFISTGGGAMLNFLAGKDLPGIKALK